MNLEDNLDMFEFMEIPSRTDMPPPSLFDTSSRDSGFEDSSIGALSDDSFFEEIANFDVSTDFNSSVQRSIVTVTVEEKPSFLREKIIPNPRKRICQSPKDFEEGEGFFLKRRKTSDSKENIQRSNSYEPADSNKTHSLPLVSSRHEDLKAISSNTLKKLLNGEFVDRVESFKIIDCRYPYEYNGGHIKNAINLYSSEQCTALLEESAKKREILIFHCEFSSKREADLCRYLKQENQRLDVRRLRFPEIYILEGGYKNFFEENSSMCFPSSYTQMLDPRHSQDFAYFRKFSRTWDSSDVDYNTGKKQMIARRFVL